MTVTVPCSTREGHWRSVCICFLPLPAQRCTARDEPHSSSLSPARTVHPAARPALPRGRLRSPLSIPGQPWAPWLPLAPWWGKNPRAKPERGEISSSGSSPRRRHLLQLKLHRLSVSQGATCTFPKFGMNSSSGQTSTKLSTFGMCKPPSSPWLAGTTDWVMLVFSNKARFFQGHRLLLSEDSCCHPAPAPLACIHHCFPGPCCISCPDYVFNQVQTHL